MQGIVIVSHAYGIAEGLKALLSEIASDIPITTAGGLDEATIGTNLPRVSDAIEQNPAQTLHVFYDLGSALMNVEMAEEMTEKNLIVHKAALVEGAFIAAAMIMSQADAEKITEELKKLIVK